jgi:Outer membrane efflux protein
VEQQVLNRYQAGQVGFTDVVNAQATAQNARRALLQLQSDRQAAAVALIQALGGGWGGLGDTRRSREDSVPRHSREGGNPERPPSAAPNGSTGSPPPRG